MMPLSVSKGSEWRKKTREGALVLLPSGLVARVRNIPVSFIFTQTGGAYNTLMPIINEFIGSKEITEKAIESLIENKAEQFFATLNLFCKLAFLSPRIVDDPQADDEIAITDLDDSDKMVVMQLLGLPAQQLERFCEIYSQSVADALSQQTVPDTTIRPDEHSATIGGVVSVSDSEPLAIVGA